MCKSMFRLEGSRNYLASFPNFFLIYFIFFNFWEEICRDRRRYQAAVMN